TYSFQVSGFGVRGEWVVGPRGRRDLRVVVGGSAELALHLVEESTGAPVDASSVAWDGASGGSFRLEHVSASEGFAGRVALGRGELDPLLGTRVVESDPIEIHAGRNELTLHLHRLPGIVLPLFCEGRRVPWSEAYS